jgi:pimeloyl-ACP methyl ester carboxylesterase
MKVTQKIALTYIRIKFKVLAAISSVKAAERAFTLFCTPYPKTKRRRPTLFNNATPLRFTLHTYTINGFRFNEGGHKRALILHGFASCVYNFHPYIAQLVAKGYEVLAFDAPAHGLSSGRTVNAVQYSEMIIAIHQNYGPVDSYLAHSFGGIALCLALERLPHSPAVRAALVAPATETTTAIDHAFSLLRLHHPAVRRAFDAIIHRLSGQPTEWYSIRRAMHHIKATTLWVHDQDDAVTPLADAQQVQQDGHDHITFVITQGLGHQQIYRDETVRNRIIDFL